MADLSAVGTNSFGLLKRVSITGPSIPGIPGGAKVIEFDCSITEEHTSETIPTEFEVENGSVISDHVVLKPRHLKIQAMITDTPLSILASILTTGIGAVAPSVGNLGSNAGAVALAASLAGSLLPSAKKSVVAFASLIDLQMARLPVTVWTSLNLYKNMWIRKISIPRDANTGKAIIVNIEFQQLLLVQPQTVTASVLNPDVGSSEADAASKGAGDNALADKFKEGNKDALAAAEALGVAP